MCLNQDQILCFVHVIHLHSSVETADCRVDESSDDGVKDEGQNLQTRKGKKKKDKSFNMRSHSQFILVEKKLLSYQVKFSEQITWSPLFVQ